jgi:hypothetical protein
MDSSWNEAAKQHYKFESVDALEEAWMESLKSKAKLDSPKDDRSLPLRNLAQPASTAPMTVLAYFDAKLKFFQVYHTFTRDEPVVTYVSKRTGGVEAVTTYLPKTTPTWASYDLDKIDAMDLRGNAISKSDLMKIDKPRTMLFNIDGKKVDPSFLEIMKSNTVILTIRPKSPLEVTAPPVIGKPADPLPSETPRRQ